jgi:ketosteroid isomerase-like protein
MKKVVLAVLASLLMAATAMASPAEVLKPIHQFIDGFNKGDTASGFAAYATAGDIVIIDEFAPHIWSGRDAAHQWAADYDNHSKATGITESIVKYGAPLVTNVETDVAYVVIPTTYVYKEKGTPITEQGKMAFVLRKESSGWKIAAWTWTGTKPQAAK